MQEHSSDLLKNPLLLVDRLDQCCCRGAAVLEAYTGQTCKNTWRLFGSVLHPENKHNLTVAGRRPPRRVNHASRGARAATEYFTEASWDRRSRHFCSRQMASQLQTRERDGFEPITHPKT